MDATTALAAFASLSQVTRLSALRLLVEHGRSALAERLGVPATTLSFHLAHLGRAGLVTATKNGRQIVCATWLERIQVLARFLLEDKCAERVRGRPLMPGADRKLP